MTKQFPLKFAPIFFVLFGLSALIVAAVQAQGMGTTVLISTMPSGMFYTVDGQVYQQPTNAVWPVGSKHVLGVPSANQSGIQVKTLYQFQQWATGSTVLPGGNIITVTADPAQPEFHAVFSVQYALDLVYFSCPDPLHCASPGTVFISGAPFNSDAEMYMAANSTVTLMAVPAAGYVFAGWAYGAHQNMQGALNTVTMSEPVTVRPIFQQTRGVNLATIPAGLQLYADRSPVPTPTTLDWGFNTIHSVGAVTPQKANDGTWWAFQSWSDGGASIHDYTVTPSQQSDTLTATFIPVGVTTILTSPVGLKIKVDGRDNWPGYNFPWGIGETHTIEAPAQQSDPQGHIWSFVSWSNGAPASQTFVVPDTAANGGIRLIATYAPLGHLMIQSSVAGVTINVDDTQCTTPCDLQRPTGTTVHVSAPASAPLGEGSRADFTGWSGSGTASTDWSGTLGSDPVTINATFRTMNRIAASSAPANGASVMLEPASPDGFYDAGSTVAVSASALPGFKFRNWSGDLTGSSASGSVMMSSPRSVQAVMDRVPYIAPAGVANAAGVTPVNAIAPGSVLSIFGASMAQSTVVGTDSPLTQTLGGVTVTVNGELLPLFFVSPTQINAQLPPDLAAGAQTLVISAQGQPDVKADFAVARNAPGLFPQSINGNTYATALHEDGSAVTPDSPARADELLTVYATGLGPTTPLRPLAFAVPASPAYAITDQVTVQVRDYTVPAVAAFAAPGSVGLDVIQFRLSAGAPTGVNAPLHITVNGQDSNTVTLPVQ
jgi:uncharacterized protein (TIGR03437 family)